MKFGYLMTVLALGAMATANAADAPAGGAPKQLSRAEVAAETERALASGEIKVGPLAEFNELMAPARPAGLRVPAEERERRMAMEPARSRGDAPSRRPRRGDNPY